MSYVLRRLLQSLIVLVGVSFVAFAQTYLTGDPTEVILGDGADRMSVTEIAAFRHKMGFDRPFLVQYGDFAWKALHGDFGYSYIRHRPAFAVVLERMPATLRLASFAFLLSVAVSVPLGVISAVRPGTWTDRCATLLALAGQSIPSFWLAILLILVFGVKLKWLPISGSAGWDAIILPGLTLAAFPIARNMRLTRSSMLDFLQRDFVRTARAKGIAERRVVWAHVLRNALLPVVTSIGLELGFLLGGSMITETIFGWPGVGREIIAAVGSKDFPVVQAGTLLVALIFAAVNLAVDLAYSLIDPRIRLGG
jgi:peptide/nickel transport system permease protein